MATDPENPAAYAVRLITAANYALRENARIAEVTAGGALDGKRAAAWCEYGWPASVSPQLCQHLYHRQGVAFGVVHRLADKCWQDPPRLVQGEPGELAARETPWEKTVKALLNKSRFWRAMYQADVRRIVSGWSGILLQLADDSAVSQWNQPVAGRPELVKAIPVWRTQLKPSRNQDGTVEYWDYTEKDSDGQQQTIKVHPTRVLILGDWRTGRGMLETPFNAFVNLEKIHGGGGESYYKNAARQLHIDFDAAADLTAIARMYGVKPEELHEVFNETARRVNQGNDIILATQGAKATPLVSSVPDPEKHAAINREEIAASFGIPVKVIVGMQTGERASTEDIRDYKSRCQQRRTHVLTYDCEDAVDQLIELGILPRPSRRLGYYVHWSDLTQATDEERLSNAAKMAEINQKSAGTGERAPFSTDEIREAAGYEALADSAPQDGEGEEDAD